MENEIKERLLKIIEEIDLTFPQLERRTGIKAMAWRNLKNTPTRANEEHIKGIITIKPEYAYWIATGKTIPEAGQISPELEEIQQKLGEAG